MDATSGPGDPPFGFDRGGFDDAEPELDEQQQAALAIASQWVGIEGPVHGVGLGATPEGQPCVVVFADRHPDDLPDEVEGLPVRVEASDEFVAQVTPFDEGGAPHQPS